MKEMCLLYISGLINKSDQYERTIFALGQLLGLAGGFHGALLGIGSLIFFIFSERLFVSAILRKIYQIDTWQEKEKLDKDKIEYHKMNQKPEKRAYKKDGRKIKNPYTESERFHSEAFNMLQSIGRFRTSKAFFIFPILMNSF